MTIYVLRAFGGVLMINVSVPTPPATNVTFYARKGNGAFYVR